MEIDVKKITESAFYKECLFPERCEPLEEPALWDLAVKRFASYLKRREAKEPIPKIIHQIWVGSSLPDKYRRYCESWKKYHPHWEYRLWDDYSIQKLGLYNKRAYVLSRSFGHKSDIARYEILYRLGGVYIDTDFECLKPLDEIIVKTSFFTGHGAGRAICIWNGIIGSKAANPFFLKLLANLNKPFLSKDGMKVIAHSGPFMFKNAFMQYLKEDEEAVLFPSIYFYPWPNSPHCPRLTDEELKKKYLKSESFAIHYWEASWLRPGFFMKMASRIKQKIKRFLGL